MPSKWNLHSQGHWRTKGCLYKSGEMVAQQEDALQMLYRVVWALTNGDLEIKYKVKKLLSLYPILQDISCWNETHVFVLLCFYAAWRSHFKKLICVFLTSFSFSRESDTKRAPHLHIHHFYFSILSCWKHFLSLSPCMQHWGSCKVHCQICSPWLLEERHKTCTVFPTEPCLR